MIVFLSKVFVFIGSIDINSFCLFISGIINMIG